MYQPLSSRHTRVARAVASLGFALSLQAALAQNVSFDIPAQPLPGALAAFARQSGLQLAFPPALVQGKQGHAVSGTRDVQAALLAGTGLQGQVQGKTLVIEPAPGPASAAPALAAVTVTAQAERSATSEGSGSYAAQGASIMKGVQSLKEIPQSVSVITRQQMDDQGLSSVEDVYTQLPGARTDGYIGTMRVFSRGFQTSMQIDGVPEQQEYGGTSFKLDSAIYDRIEMLRGPSGVVTGTGEPGGTINLVRKRPRDKFGFSSNVSYGSWNTKRTDVDVTGPLNASGSLRGRAVGVVQDNDQFYDVAHAKRHLVYGVLEYDITPQDTLGFSATRMEDVNNTFWGLPRYSDGSLPGRSTFVGSTDRNTRVKTTDATLDYRHLFANGWESKATYIYRQDDKALAGLYALGPIDVATGLVDALGINREDTAVYNSFDFHISGPFTLLGRNHRASLGFNRTRQEWDVPRRLHKVYSGVDVTSTHSWGVSPDDLATYGYAQDIVQSGVYGSVSLRLLDPVALVLGGRVSSYRYKSRETSTSDWVTSAAKADNEFTPHVGLVVDLNEQVSVYGSYAEIFVPQSTRDYTGETLRPRTGEQYELGVKGAFLAGRLNASLAVYQMRDENRAMEDTDLTHVCTENANQRCMRAAGKIQSRGIEAEVSGTPVPGWNISSSYAFNRTVYLSDTNPANVGQTVTGYANPRHLLKIWTQYALGNRVLDGALAGWSIGGGVIAQSALEANGYRQGGYAIASAKLDYQVNKNLHLSLNVDNLFDRTYLVDFGSSYYYNIYGKPRNYRLTLAYKFE